VCQDQAHVLLAACRAAGIACRYVSGHMVGQGGTHAWVEVVVPDGAAARAVAFDPCHGCRADRRYVTVAVGRDYLDVPPTSGWYSGPARGRLSGTRELVEQPVAA
jgi:transglutaminase-like putative cysteine protease